MKRKINFAPVIIILGIFVALFWFVPYIAAVGISSPNLSWSRYKPYIKYENAPAGTAYLDILVKLDPTSEDYTDFNELQIPPRRLTDYREITELVESETGEVFTRTIPDPKYEEIPITPESAIAKLNDGGYVSLSLHCKGVRGFQISENSSQLVLTEEREFDIKELYKRYGNFKAAYVGENGEVLGVTESASVEYEPRKSYEFSADKDALCFTIYGSSPAQVIGTHILFFGWWAAVIALVVFIVLAIINTSKFGSHAPNLDAREKNRK